MRKRAIIAMILALASEAAAQTVINGSRQILGHWDASQAASTKTARQAAEDPLACSEGEIYYNSSIHKHRECTDSGWADMGGSGTAGGSVGLAMPAEFTVSGSPTVGGTITVGKAAQGANTVLAGPVTGAPEAPVFRALAPADIPTRPTPFYYQYVAAKCLSGTPLGAFSTPTVNAPTPVCTGGGGPVSGLLRFSGSTPQSVQDHFGLPPDWTGAIDMEIAARSADAAHAASIGIQTACVGQGTIESVSFAAAQTAGFTAASASARTTVGVTNINTAGCSAGDEFYFKLTVDSSALTSGLDLISIRFTVRRAI